jgi:hypothetical protein
MVIDLESMDLLHESLDFVDTRITKFENGAALVADNMIVLLVRVGALVERLVLSELMSLY